MRLGNIKGKKVIYKNKRYYNNKKPDYFRCANNILIDFENYHLLAAITCPTKLVR